MEAEIVDALTTLLKNIVTLFILNIPVFFLVAKYFFYSTLEDFIEDLRYIFQPGWISMLKGEEDNDFYASLKIYVLMILCAIIVYLEYQLFF